MPLGFEREIDLHPAADLAPAVELAKRYCWVTNTLRQPPEIRYHDGEALG